MAKGGKRKGAGRKKGSKASHTLEAEKAREYLVNRVTSELDPILTAQIEAAKGLYYEKVTNSKKIKVFKKEPDINAGKYLVDQTVGKAKESVEVRGNVIVEFDE